MRASEGAFTPDANKSRYSHEVGRLNILSLLAPFAPQDCLSRLCIDLTCKSFASGVNAP